MVVTNVCECGGWFLVCTSLILVVGTALTANPFVAAGAFLHALSAFFLLSEAYGVMEVAQ